MSESRTPPTPSGGRALITSAALLWGLQFAFLNPTIGLLLVALYDATPGQVGWSLAAYNVSGFVSTLIVPTRADRRGDYLRPMLWCGVLTVALVTALALVSTLPLAVVALIALGGPAGVGIGLLFAHQRHTGASDQEVMRTRAMFSFAWVAGPPLAAFIVGLLGNRAILWAVALVAAVTIGATYAMIRQRTAHGLDVAPAAVGAPLLTLVGRPHVLALVLAFVLLQSTNTAAVSITTLYVSDHLGLDPLWGGVALGTAAALEIPALLLLGRFTHRIPAIRLIVVGAVAGVAYNLAMAVLDGPAPLVAVQVFNALFVAAVSGVGLTLFQRVVPRPGLASGLFMNAHRIGAILAGLLIALAGVPALGYPSVFVACAAVTGLGLALVLVSHRLQPTPSGGPGAAGPA